MNELTTKDNKSVEDSIFKDLSKKEEAFVRIYVDGGMQDKKNSAVMAGYAAASAGSQACQLVRKKKIMVALGNYIKTVVVPDARNSLLLHMIKKYTALSNFNITKIIDIKTGKLKDSIKSADDMTLHQQMAIKSIKEKRYGRDGDKTVMEYEFMKHTEADKFLKEILTFANAATDAAGTTVNVQANGGEAGSGVPVINISVGQR